MLEMRAIRAMGQLVMAGSIVLMAISDTLSLRFSSLTNETILSSVICIRDGVRKTSVCLHVLCKALHCQRSASPSSTRPLRSSTFSTLRIHDAVILARLARSLSKSVTTLRSSTFSKERFAVVCAFSAKLDILKPVHDLTQRTLQAWKSFSSSCPKSVLLSAIVCAAAVTLCAYLLSKACARPCTANSASV